MTQDSHGMTHDLLARRFVNAFNTRDTTALRRLYHPDATVKRPTWPADGRVEASLDSIQLDFGAYPDGKLEVRHIIAQDRAAVVVVPVAWAGAISPRPCGDASAAACRGSRSGLRRSAFGKTRASATSTARSVQDRWSRGAVRRSTATSCRSASISASLDEEDLASNASHDTTVTSSR
jgi:hypothetical protein